MTVDTATTDTPKKRKATRETRRIQLIEATIRVLSREGYSRITLSRVAQEADLSHGLVNFHFASKEGLLSETLAYLATEYRDNWMQALAAAPAAPAARLHAIILADFDPRVSSADRLSAWCSFWGEAQARPIYKENCAQNDAEYARVLESLCADLMDEGGYGGDAQIAARVLRVASEGTWLEMMTMTSPYERAEALKTVLACAASFFPDHFTAKGLRRR